MGWQPVIEELSDTVRSGPAARLAAALGRPPPGPELPPLWHWLYCLAAVARSDTGEDGHRARGRFVPPAPGRRMFAGGRVSFHAPLRLGDELLRRSEVIAVTDKRGRSGPFVLVTVRHVMSNAAGIALTEEQDLVYTEAAPAGPAPGAPIPEAPWRESVATDPVLLFRFSALTFNGHRIHYDAGYAAAEGYPGLVVHGPLVALLLAGLAVERGGRPLREFGFRARAPFDCGDTLELRGTPGGDGADLAAYTPAGVVGMEARAEFSR